MRTLKLCIAFLIALCNLVESLPTACAAIPSRYKVTDLGILPFVPNPTQGLDTYSSGARVNSTGQVTGSSTVGTTNPVIYPTHAFLYDGALHDLGSLSQEPNLDYSEGNDINDSGQIVGASTTSNGVLSAVLYDGTMHDLGTLLGFAGSTSRAYGINSSGQVVGESNIAFLWQPTTPNGSSGTMHSLGSLKTSGNLFSTAADINDLGHVTGSSSVNGGETHAFLWVPSTPNGTTGVMHDLGTLGGTHAFSAAINANGLIVGSSQTESNEYRAFLWSPDTPNGTTGSMLDLGTLTVGASYAIDINSEGLVVGSTEYEAFIYSSDSGMIDLNTLIDPQSGWYLYDALGINDVGQITGSGEINGQWHAFLLTPVPEPASAVALASILGFAVLMRRQALRAICSQS